MERTGKTGKGAAFEEYLFIYHCFSVCIINSICLTCDHETVWIFMVMAVVMAVMMKAMARIMALTCSLPSFKGSDGL